jgi:hypothetical protein
LAAEGCIVSGVVCVCSTWQWAKLSASRVLEGLSCVCS